MKAFDEHQEMLRGREPARPALEPGRGAA